MKKITLLLIVVGMSVSIFAQDSQSDDQAKCLAEQIAGDVEFMELPYAYDALEPYIDKITLETHYGKHHKGYYNKFMKAIEGTEMEKMTVLEIFQNISELPMAVRNNGGGYFNHAFYWKSMSPKGGEIPSGVLLEAINETFGSFEEFKAEFSNAGKTTFGSGWAWLSLDAEGKLFISSTSNQNNPFMDDAKKQGFPLLTMDVWEHAYYLKYMNRRGDYIDAFWNVVSWEVVAKRYEMAISK